MKTLTPILLVMILLSVSCKKDKVETPKAANLYFSFWDDNSINMIDLVNTPNSVTTLFDDADGIVNPEGIALTKDGYLIVTEEGNNRVLKMQKNGSGNVVVLYDLTDGVSSPTGVAVDDATGVVYWCNSGTQQIMKGSLDGLTPLTTLYSGATIITSAYGLAIDKKHGKLVIGDFYKFILSGNLDGTGTPQVLWDPTKFDGMVAPSNVFIDAGRNKIYWTDEAGDQIVEANLDGTETPLVLFESTDGVNRPDGIAVDAASGKIYWSETNGNVVARGNLDGTGAREVLVSGVEPYCIILEFE